jgi:hypothetical protein
LFVCFPYFNIIIRFAENPFYKKGYTPLFKKLSDKKGCPPISQKLLTVKTDGIFTVRFFSIIYRRNAFTIASAVSSGFVASVLPSIRKEMKYRIAIANIVTAQIVVNRFNMPSRVRPLFFEKNVSEPPLIAPNPSWLAGCINTLTINTIDSNIKRATNTLRIIGNVAFTQPGRVFAAMRLNVAIVVISFFL